MRDIPRRDERGIVIGLLLVALSIFMPMVAGGSTPAVPETHPSATPTPLPTFAECPFCHDVLPARDLGAGKKGFVEHDFYRLKLSDAEYFETCMSAIVRGMRRVVDGRVIKGNFKDGARPLDGGAK
jgi:hypothetical protein